MNSEDHRAVSAVGREISTIVRAADIIKKSLSAGGKIFLFGAGTSGRLGVLEAAECPPTFGTKPSAIQAVIAGGRKAVFASQEGAEDKFPPASKIVVRLNPKDVVIGIAASGITPFTRAALQAGQNRKCQTIFITCNPEELTKSSASVVIALNVGPEIIAGSTRLKAATATKLALNMLTTIAMVRLGKTYGPWMVDLKPQSRKLQLRALRIVSEIANLSSQESAIFLKKTRGNAKLAVLMARQEITLPQARAKLKAADGFLRRALASY